MYSFCLEVPEWLPSSMLYLQTDPQAERKGSYAMVEYRVRATCRDITGDQVIILSHVAPKNIQQINPLFKTYDPAHAVQIS